VTKYNFGPDYSGLAVAKGGSPLRGCTGISPASNRGYCADPNLALRFYDQRVCPSVELIMLLTQFSRPLGQLSRYCGVTCAGRSSENFALAMPIPGTLVEVFIPRDHGRV
jgi:hypothetical protein